jgi:putative membrane protein
MMWYNYSDYGWIGMVVMMLFWLGVLGLLAWGISQWFSSQRAKGTFLPSSEPNAREILRHRFAQGEIDAVTFRQMEAALRESEQQT